MEGRQSEAEIDSYNAKRRTWAEKSKENNVLDVREVNRTGRTDEDIALKHYDRRIGEVVPISWTPTVNGPRLERLSTDVQPKNSVNESGKIQLLLELN